MKPLLIVFVFLAMYGLSADSKEKETIEYYNTHAQERIKMRGVDGDKCSRWIEFIEELQKYVSPGAVVLDIGFGGGLEAREFIKKGYDYTGIEPAEQAVSLIKERFPDQRFLKGSIYSLEFPDNFFDVLWCTAVLLHIPPEKINLALQEMKRVLKPGGILFIALIEGKGELYHEDSRWYFLYEQKEFADILERNGLTIEKMEILPDTGHQTLRKTWITVFARKK